MKFHFYCRCGLLFLVAVLVGMSTVLFVSKTHLEAPVMFFVGMMSLIITYGIWYFWKLIQYWWQRSHETRHT